MTFARRRPNQIPAPRFAIGQKVHLANDRSRTMTKGATYEIMAVLPPAGRLIQYRIRDLKEMHDRIAAENELTLIGMWSTAPH